MEMKNKMLMKKIVLLKMKRIKIIKNRFKNYVWLLIYLINIFNYDNWKDVKNIFNAKYINFNKKINRYYTSKIFLYLIL